MSSLRLYLDEDVYGAVTEALRNSAVDVLSTLEAQRTGEPNESQLLWATSESRALFTFNVGDFVRMHCDWLAAGRSHAGIIVSSQRSLSDTLSRLTKLAIHLDEESMRDRLEFLSDW